MGSCDPSLLQQRLSPRITTIGGEYSKGGFMTQYVFGLDIGIASVGWAVLDEQRIVDLGVRCFDKAETAKEGDPLNLARRQARLLRRRLYRRAWRLTQLARLFKREGLIGNAKLFASSPAFTEPDPTDLDGKRQRLVSAWELRSEERRVG